MQFASPAIWANLLNELISCCASSVSVAVLVHGRESVLRLQCGGKSLVLSIATI